MYSKISEWMLKRASYITKFESLCFTSQIFLFCSFTICLSKAVTESAKSRNSKTSWAENRENGGKSRKLTGNKQQLFIGP